MKRQYLIAIAIAFYFLITTSFAKIEPFYSFVDKQVGKILIGKSKIEEVLQFYGQAYSEKNFHGEILHYYVVDNKAYLSIAFHDGIVETIMLSKTTNKKIEDECRTKYTINETVTTGKGLRLDDNSEKVVEIYGEPQKKEVKEGLLIFEYHTDYKADPNVDLAYDSYLYFKENKITKIVIHDGE